VGIEMSGNELEKLARKAVRAQLQARTANSAHRQNQTEAKTAADNAKRILKVAKAAYSAAQDLCSCIELLKAGNRSDVIASLQKANAREAVDLIQKALLGRLVMGVTCALAPKRDFGDFHLRVGMGLIREEIPRQVILLRGGNLADIKKAERLWAKCEKYKPTGWLRIYRNKVVAHLSELPANMKDPKIAELFTLARMIAGVAEGLAHGTGITTISLDTQMRVFRKRARAFWKKWKLGDTRRSR